MLLLFPKNFVSQLLTSSKHSQTHFHIILNVNCQNNLDWTKSQYIIFSLKKKKYSSSFCLSPCFLTFFFSSCIIYMVPYFHFSSKAGTPYGAQPGLKFTMSTTNASNFEILSTAGFTSMCHHTWLLSFNSWSIREFYHVSISKWYVFVSLSKAVCLYMMERLKLNYSQLYNGILNFQSRHLLCLEST